jgi:DNA-3-methyladenine glycosylase I
MSRAANPGPSRCPWPGIADPEYARYHDEEWGVPRTGDRELFEKIVLEGVQAGLSWLTILRKREAFRRAFAGFDPERIARFTPRDVERLMQDGTIVRNRAKIEATIANAEAMLALAGKGGLARLVWSFLPDGPIVHRRRRPADVPAETELSRAISKALKREGFRFVGPTTVYAFMQSSGLVNDHLVGCHRHGPCSDLQRAAIIPRF